MNQPSTLRLDFFLKACAFEASLILIALILGKMAGIDPFASLIFSEPAVFYGIIGTVPLILVFHLLEQRRESALQKIRGLLLDTLGPMLHGQHWTNLLMLAAIAGLSEEVLFRGGIQPWFEGFWGDQAGMIVGNILFGLVHAVTPLYAVLAFLIGLYLSFSLDFEGERNLLTPVVIHALYDFWAFLALAKAYGQRRSEQDDHKNN